MLLFCNFTTKLATHTTVIEYCCIKINYQELYFSKAWDHSKLIKILHANKGISKYIFTNYMYSVFQPFKFCDSYMVLFFFSFFCILNKKAIEIYQVYSIYHSFYSRIIVKIKHFLYSQKS